VFSAENEVKKNKHFTKQTRPVLKHLLVNEANSTMKRQEKI